MSKHSASQRVSRRGLAAAGALSLTFAGGAFAVAGADSASAAGSGTAKYTCALTNPGLAKTFSDPWTVTTSADFPSTVNVGAALPAPTVTANVTTGKDAADQLRALGVKTVKGTAKANYTVGGASSTADLTIPQVSVPASGGVVTVASGTGEAATAPSKPTTLTVAAGSFTTTQTTDSGFILDISCSPAAGADTTIGKIKVVDPNASTTTTPTSPTTTTDPTTPTTPTTAPTTPTTDPTTPTTDPTTPTTDPTTPTTDPTTKSSTPTTKPTTPTTKPTKTSSTGTPTSTTSSASSTSAPASTSSATSTSGGSTSSPVVAPTGSHPTQGPKIQTDSVSNKQGLNMLGAGFALAGVTALGGAVVLGRRRNN